MFSLEHKVAVITGASSGIGRAIALVFAKQGAYVQLLDMDQDGGRETARQIEQSGGQGRYYQCNVSLQSEVKDVISSIIQQHAVIDILVNDAGIAHIGTVETTEEQDFDRLFAVNVKGVYHLMHHVIPYMKGRGGVILNMASVAAVVGIPDRFAYTMTKGAVAAMTLSVARDYLKENIRCNCISPARVHTPFVEGFLAKNYPGREQEMLEKLAKTQPIGRMGRPDEIAALALYLCSDEAAFITGCDYPIDGGFIKLNN